MPQKYELVGNPTITKRVNKLINKKIKLFIVILSLAIISIITLNYNNEKIKEDNIKQSSISSDMKDYYIKEEKENNYLFIKGKSRKDKYGLELNINILDGIYNIGFNNSTETKIEDIKLYTPPCPNLQPFHYPDSIINPKCEGSSVQITNYNNDNGKGLPYVLHLDSITNQMKKWNSWEKLNITNQIYFKKTVKELVDNEYHPFDYGYIGNDTTSDIDDETFYNSVVTSRMDEVSDPRRRRVFTFILFNGEFDLLDLYLAEFYEIIDYFVIYESNSTFTGKPKPLYFTRTLFETDRYDKFKDKLIPLPMETIVDEDNGRGKGFPREHLARRNVIEKGLQSVQARHGDIFMHGDLDEFPRPHILSLLKKCGGWEHLQAGVGGGPKSFKNGNIDSYFVNNKTNAKTNKDGEYLIDYERDRSVGFLSWFYEYSLNIIENKDIGTVAHPNIAIFDARRSLGQLVDRYNGNMKMKREVDDDNYDPLLDPTFNPYKGYTYTDNTNDRRIGKGYLGEKLRFATSKVNRLGIEEKPVFWNGGWHLSSFLPTIDQFLNKVASYSHNKDYKYKSQEDLKKDIISRIKGHYYIFGKKKKYFDNKIVMPESYTKGYQYNFDYIYWQENIKANGTNQEFKDYLDRLTHEIPNQIWKNPICYSFMIDRDYGLEKKLWWQVIPKEEWKTVRFEQLDEKILNEITPQFISESFRNEMFKAMEDEH